MGNGGWLMNRWYEWLERRYPLSPLRVCHEVERQTAYFTIFPLVRPCNFQSTYVKRVSERKRASTDTYLYLGSKRFQVAKSVSHEQYPMATFSA